MGLLWILILIGRIYYNSDKFLSVGRNFLLIVAHPDDETMFFMPTLTWIRQMPALTLSLLSLSNGNFEGLGKQRETELLKCADIHLGIPTSRISLIDDSMIQDGWELWKPEALVPHIENAVKKYRPDVILTFDEYGLGHPNHMSVYHGVSLFLEDLHTNSSRPIAFALKSVSLIRKYASFMDVIGQIFSSNVVLTKNPLSTIQSLMVHQTQLTWFRILYCIFSSYVWFNCFEEIGI